MTKVLKGVCAGLFVAVALTGCKGASRPAPGVEQQLSSLMGADISTAVAVLGFPDTRREGGGERTYVWSRERPADRPQPEIRIGSYSNKTDPSAQAPCTVELTADASGRIAGYHWSGTDARCSWVVQAFLKAEHEDQGRQ